MKRFLMIFATFCTLLLPGCAGMDMLLDENNPNTEWMARSTCPGTRPEDPQLCRGEHWGSIPNPRNGQRVNTSPAW